MRWARLAVAVAGLVVVGWAVVTAWGAIAAGHPAYLVLLGLTVVGCLLALIRRRAARRRVWATVGLLGASAWIAGIGWLRPFVALEPALGALASDEAVTVSQSAGEIVLAPTRAAASSGVFFQPGARVDPRAYAALLRPLAQSGHLVVIAKQPLGVGFLGVGAFDAARAAHPQVQSWVLGGHSLGGTVASGQADAADSDAVAPAVGLFLLASYPASDIGESLSGAVLSVSGSVDGLATPAKIAAARPDLPDRTAYRVIEGAGHAQFGDYGPQPGDGTPTIDNDTARREIQAILLDFVGTIPDSPGQ